MQTIEIRIDHADDLPTPTCKNCLREKIAQEVAEFLMSGGTIDILQPDATGLYTSEYQKKILRSFSA